MQHTIATWTVAGRTLSMPWTPGLDADPTAAAYGLAIAGMPLDDYEARVAAGMSSRLSEHSVAGMLEHYRPLTTAARDASVAPAAVSAHLSGWTAEWQNSLTCDGLRNSFERDFRDEVTLRVGVDGDCVTIWIDAPTVSSHEGEVCELAALCSSIEVALNLHDLEMREEGLAWGLNKREIWFDWDADVNSESVVEALREDGWQVTDRDDGEL